MSLRIFLRLTIGTVHSRVRQSVPNDFKVPKVVTMILQKVLRLPKLYKMSWEAVNISLPLYFKSSL